MMNRHPFGKVSHTPQKRQTILRAASASEAILAIRSRRKLQQLRRRKMICAMFCCLFMITLLITCVYAKATNAPAAPPLTVQVEAGDSLWSLAQKYCPNQDIRTAILEIKELNQLKGDIIFQGDLLLIPAE